MGGYTQEHELQNKSKVALAYWEDLKPTEHSDRLKNNTWNQHKGREGLAFYDSTIQYMRNDWAASNMGIGTVNDTNGQKAMLFYSKDTRTWHTADALDIDHATQWLFAWPPITTMSFLSRASMKSVLRCAMGRPSAPARTSGLKME